MILKVTTRHAICTVIYLAENGVDRIVTAKEISSKRKIPINYLPRILSKMVKKGIIEERVEKVIEEHYIARLKAQNANLPEGSTPAEFSQEQFDRLKKNLMMVASGCCPMCSIGERIRRGKLRAKMRREREAEEAARRKELPGMIIDK